MGRWMAGWVGGRLDGWVDRCVGEWMDGWMGLPYPLCGLLQDADPILITFTSLALRTVPESHNCPINIRGKDAGERVDRQHWSPQLPQSRLVPCAFGDPETDNVFLGCCLILFQQFWNLLLHLVEEKVQQNLPPVWRTETITVCMVKVIGSFFRVLLFLNLWGFSLKRC